jgi:hypothetical protein
MKELAAEVAAERNPKKFQELVTKLRVVLEDLRAPKPAKPDSD